jgi:hypothetical protein
MAIPGLNALVFVRIRARSFKALLVAPEVEFGDSANTIDCPLPSVFTFSPVLQTWQIARCLF